MIAAIFWSSYEFLNISEIMRLFVTIFAFMLVVLGLLADTAPDLMVDVIFFAVLLILAGLILKLVLEFTLYRKKKEVDKKSYQKIFDESDVQTFLDIEDYNKAAESRHRQRLGKTSSRL